MAFKDVFEETRKKMNNYFGLAQPGLGTFGKQVSSVVRPTVNFVKQNLTPAGFVNKKLIQPAVRANINTLDNMRVGLRPTVNNLARQVKTQYNAPRSDSSMNLAQNIYNTPKMLQGSDRWKSSVNNIASQVKTPIANYFRPTPQVRTRDVVRELGTNLAGFAGYESPQQKEMYKIALQKVKSGTASPQDLKLAREASSNVGLMIAGQSGGMGKRIPRKGADALSNEARKVESGYLTRFTPEKKLSATETKMATIEVMDKKGNVVGSHSFSRKPDEDQINRMADELVREHSNRQYFNSKDFDAKLKEMKNLPVNQPLSPQSTPSALSNEAKGLTDAQRLQLTKDAVHNSLLAPIFSPEEHASIDKMTNWKDVTKAIADKPNTNSNLFVAGDYIKNHQADILSPQSTQGASTVKNLNRVSPQPEISATKSPNILEQKPTPQVQGKTNLAESPVKTLAENPKNVSLNETIPPNGADVNVDPVQKIIGALKEAKPLSLEQKGLNAKLRKQQFAKMMSARGKTSGEQGYFSELGALKGGAKKVDFEAVRPQLTQTDVDTLFNRVNEANIGEWEKLNAKASLSKLLDKDGGTIPTQNELKLLNDVFGDEFVKTILDKRSNWQKFLQGAGEVLNLPRSLMASFDLSAPFRQGIVMTSRPKQFIPAFMSMFKQAGSEKAFKAVQEGIQAHPNYKLMRESKLALTDMGNFMSNREETFMSNLGEKIPVLKYGIKASNRAYTGFLNKLRADVFNDLVSKAELLGRDKTEVASDIAKFVNSATGRGDLGALNKAAPILNSAFFSPRLMAARINMLNPIYYAKLDPMVRKEAVKSMLIMGATAGTALGLAKAGGAEVGTDPRSADFGKIKVGDTRYDILGGFQQYIVLASRLISGKMVSSTTGKEISLTEGYKPTTRLDIIINFLKSKENPILSYITGAAEGTTQIGQEFKAVPEAINRFIPMFAQDIVDLTEDRGFMKAIGMELPSMFGIGVQTYGKQIPTMKDTPSGSKLQWRNPADIGERIYNKITGEQTTEFSPEEQKSLDTARRQTAQTKADNDKVVATVTKQIKKGEKVDGVKTLADGRGLYVLNGEIKYADTPEKAKKEIEKDTFDKSGKKSELKDGTYFYRKADGDIGTYTEKEYNFKIREQRLSILEENKNYPEWSKLVEEQLKDLQEQMKDADPLTAMELENKWIDLAQKAAKYKSYGGFTKGSKGTKFSGFDKVETAKIPVRSAKKPTYKVPVSKPKSTVLSIKPRQISKSTLARR